MSKLTLVVVLLLGAVAHAEDKQPVKIWNRTGPLGETPKHVTDAFPLSDQQNKGGWVKFEPMSDEFEGKELDLKKWTLGIEGWKGRQPALFSDKNVTVSDGKLHLTMRKEKLPADLAKQGYHDYTSAALHSKARTAYGYFEVKAKPMNSGGSSSFWFHDEGKSDWRTEIDVFEIGGKAKGFENKYNMTVHVWQTPTEKKHWQVGGVWIAPWRLADAYHVYGFEWGKEELKFHVDGVVVRTVENTHWHQPLFLTFDSETMPDWMGMPKDEDLPSTFSVEYVRAWKKDDPIGRRLSERIGPYRQDLSIHRDKNGKRESWMREYERLTLDEKIHYCIFQLRNESWAEWDRPVGDNPYSKEPEGSASQELVKLGRPAIPFLLRALESRTRTEIYPSFHPMERPWLVQDAALDVIENITCKRFREKTFLPMFSDTDEGEHRQVQKTIADWWERNNGRDEIQWAKEVLLSDQAVGGGNRGAAIDSLYNRLGKESYPLLAKAYHRFPKTRDLSDFVETFQTELDKEAILRWLLESPTANEKAVFASALDDGPFCIRIKAAEGLRAIGDPSGVESIVKETEESLQDWGMKQKAADYEEQVSFLLRCNTPSSREAIYKCLRGQNSYLRQEALRSIPSLRMEKAVRALPELFDDPFAQLLALGGVTAEAFTKVVPDAPRFDGTTAETQQASIDKMKQWWKENGSKLKWDEKRGVLALPKKE